MKRTFYISTIMSLLLDNYKNKNDVIFLNDKKFRAINKYYY